MLTIREEQMAVLDSCMMRQYEDRVLQTIAKTYPEQYQQDGEERMRILIQEGVRKGERYGITSDDDMESYILVLVERGLDFEQHESMTECRDLLEDQDLPGDAKVRLIRRQLKSEPIDVELGLLKREGG